MADDPLGVAFDVMVPEYVKGVGAEGEWRTIDVRLVPNPAITRECGTCNEWWDDDNACPDCGGRGWTFRSSVRVAERWPVIGGDPWEDGDHDDREGSPSEFTPMRFIGVVGSSVTLWWRGEGTAWARRDITHLWEQPCPEPSDEHRTNGLGACIYDGHEWPCPAVRRKPIVVPPEPGSVWEIGWREAELLPVMSVADSGAGGPSAHIIVWGDGQVRLYPLLPMAHGGCPPPVNITHHFPTPPEPGQRAGVLGELVLYEQARRVEP